MENNISQDFDNRIKNNTRLITNLAVVIILIILLFIVIHYNSENKINNKIDIINTKLNTVELKLDSIYSQNYLLKDSILLLKDSLNNIFIRNAFFIKKDDILVDNRGYFYSKYHRKY